MNALESKVSAAASLLAGVLVLCGSDASASLRYVNLNSANPTSPYTTWATAATSIQDAIDVAVAGDEIQVTNGVYQTGGRAVYGTMTNRVAVNKRVALRSVNGPQFTVIMGYQLPGPGVGDRAIRCVYLTNGASLFGFTLTNGATRGWFADGVIRIRQQCGGGVWGESTNAAVADCILTGNSAFWDGGGAYTCTLSNCTLFGNSAYHGGGAWGADQLLSRRGG